MGISIRHFCDCSRSTRSRVFSNDTDSSASLSSRSQQVLSRSGIRVRCQALRCRSTGHAVVKDSFSSNPAMATLQTTRSIPLPCGFWRRTLAHAPLIPSPLLQPFLRRQLQLSVQLRTWLFPVYEIAKTPSDTAFPTVQATTRFSKVRDG